MCCKLEQHIITIDRSLIIDHASDGPDGSEIQLTTITSEIGVSITKCRKQMRFSLTLLCDDDQPTSILVESLFLFLFCSLAFITITS